MDTSKSTQCVKYTSPAHGGWGIVRVGMLIPEIYQLFVCPFACGRHGAIGALEHGYKDRLSYLYIDEADIVSGNYEPLVIEAVGQLLEVLDWRPRAIMVVVSCLDDLLGTDLPALMDELAMAYPGIKFTEGHMNPISLDGNLPPPVTVLAKMYSLLDKSAKQLPAVNLLGNHAVLDPDNEIFALLRAQGMEVREIGQCKTYDDFQEMAASRLNLVVRPSAKLAARQLEERLGMPWLYLPVGYDLDAIEAQYRELFGALFPGVAPDLAPYRAGAEAAVARALKAAGDRPLAVDFAATVFPFRLARTLHDLGFNVRYVIAPNTADAEGEDLKCLRDERGVEILDSTAPIAATVPRKDARILSVGFEGAYYFGSEHVVPLSDDEAMYGFHGVIRLMDMIVRAAEVGGDLRKMIEDYGFVV